MKKKQMVILAALLVVLAAVYGILSFQNKKAEKAEQAEESQVIKVTELDDVTSFSFRTPDQEELNFKKKDDEWICTDDRKVSLEQTYPDRIVETFSGLTASRKLEEIDDLEDYGLDAPAYTVTLKTADGGETVIKIGDGTGEEYYLQVEGEEDVIYTAASTVVENLNYSLEDMQEQEEDADTDAD